MSPIKNVTGTAFVVAEFRARENDQPHPLYVDQVVPIFLDRRTRHAADAISADFAPAEINVRLRTRYLDDRLDRHLADGLPSAADLKAGVRALSIAFDYMDTAVVRKTTGEAGTTTFAERFAAMGAPWHYGIDDVGALAAETGLTVADATTVADLHRKFWPGQPLESIVYEHYSLCTLKS